MKVEIQAQEIDVDLEEIAYQGANGSILAFGKMLNDFCCHLYDRERSSGLTQCQHFEAFFASFLEDLPEGYEKSMMNILKERNNAN